LPSISGFVGGTNLSGLEFTPSALPGTANTDYGVPTHAEIDYFVGKGMRFVRLPFLWERMQPTLGGDLAADYFARVKDLVSYATGKGAYVLIDPHNYARYHGKVVGSTDSGAPTAAQLGDLWAKLAQAFASDPKVVFGLMNEPSNMDTSLWLSDANAAIAAIRQAGAKNVITVPGNYWTGAHSWTTSNNGTVMLGVVDPLDNWIYEVHQYLDADSSGTNATCPSTTVGADALKAFTAWLKTNGKRAMLGEIGAANNPTCLGALDGLLAHMDGNRDVWVGYTYWAAGPFWGDYMYSIEPKNLGKPEQSDAPQLPTLLKHL
jgi:endoglucanase